MLDELKTTLRRLRETIAARAEKAYGDRDAAEHQSHAQSYAAGESHAYGVAEDDVRRAEKANDQGD